MAELWIGVVIAAVCATGCSELRKGYDKGFKESFLKQFNESCAKGAGANGAPTAGARSMCTCIGQYLVDHNSSTDLTKLSANPNSVEFANAVKAATAACMPAAVGAAVPSAH